MNLAPSQPDFIPRTVGDHLLSKAAMVARINRAQGTQERMEARQEAAEKSHDMMLDLLDSPGLLVKFSELSDSMRKGLNNSDAHTVFRAKDEQGDRDFQNGLNIIRTAPIYNLNTNEGKAKLSNDINSFRRNVDEKKLVGPDIIAEAQKTVQPQIEQQNHNTIKTLLDNIWNIGTAAMTRTVPVITPAKTQEKPDAPKSGDTKKNSNGDTVVFKDGAWALAPSQ
jgi:hypothetical protein